MKTEVGIHFDLEELGCKGLEKLFEIERLFHEIGISFDTGAGGGQRDWEWDWSLEGPVEVKLKLTNVLKSIEYALK